MSSSLIQVAFLCGFSSSGRAPPCQGGGSEFEPRNPLHFLRHRSQVVRQRSAKSLCSGSNPDGASMSSRFFVRGDFSFRKFAAPSAFPVLRAALSPDGGDHSSTAKRRSAVFLKHTFFAAKSTALSCAACSDRGLCGVRSRPPSISCLQVFCFLLADSSQADFSRPLAPRRFCFPK